MQANSGGTSEAGGSVRLVPWALLWEASSGLGWQVALEFAYLDGSIQTEVSTKAVLLVSYHSHLGNYYSSNYHIDGFS